MLLCNPRVQWRTWWLELSGEDAAADRGEPFFTYLWVIWELLFPWILSFAAGLYYAAMDAKHHRNFKPSPRVDQWQRYALLLVAILIPLLLMSIRKEKKDRYLLPILTPAAVLAARAGRVYFTILRPRRGKNDWAGGAHWIIVAIATLGLPILGLTHLPERFHGLPAYSTHYARIALAVAVFLLVGGFYTHLTRRPGMLIITLLLMLVTAHVFTIGYATTAPGRSNMKPLADALWRAYPDAQLFTTQPLGVRASADLSIYMNRTTGWTSEQDMSTPRPGHHPQVVIVEEHEHKPMSRPPAPWQLFMTISRGDGSSWYAFVLSAAK
jgi:hypothetical protein